MAYSPAAPVETPYSATKLKYNNAAGRLYEVVRRLRNGKHDVEMMQVWWKALALESRFGYGSTPEHRLILFQYLHRLARQLDEVEQEAKFAFPGDEELYIQHFSEFRSVLAPEQTNINWSLYAGRLTAGVTSDLGHCAKDLPKEDAVEVDALTAIYNQAEELKKAIQAADDLDPRLREWLSDLALSMQKAIDEYELCGGKSFEKAWGMLVGNMIVHYGDMLEAKKQAPEIVERTTSLLERIRELACVTRVKTGTLLLLGAGALVTGAVARIGERVTDAVIDAVAAGQVQQEKVAKDQTAAVEPVDD